MTEHSPRSSAFAGATARAAIPTAPVAAALVTAAATVVDAGPAEAAPGSNSPAFAPNVLTARDSIVRAVFLRPLNQSDPSSLTILLYTPRISNTGAHLPTKSDAWSFFISLRTSEAAIRSETPDLVLLDVGVPPMDGLTTLSLLRDDPKLRDIPVVLVTGQADENTIARAGRLGVKGYR